MLASIKLLFCNLSRVKYDDDDNDDNDVFASATQTEEL